MLNFVNNRFWFSLASVIVIVIGIVSLALFGLNLGIEFKSGSTMTVRFEQLIEQSELRQELATLGHEDAIIQRTGEGDFFIHTEELADGEKDQLVKSMEQDLGSSLKVRDYYLVSPIIAQEIWRNAGIAMVLAAVGILLYIAWAFRRMPKPFRWSLCAIVALIHDVVITVGIFSILGKVSNVEINAMFIIGILTILGYSVNNTIVVFDRIRENIGKDIRRPFKLIVNDSLVETIGRSLNTSLTTVFVLIALLLFGGPTIHNFILVLLVGFIVGTYSSLFISSQLLVTWETRNWGRPSEKAPSPRTAP